MGTTEAAILAGISNPRRRAEVAAQFAAQTRVPVQVLAKPLERRIRQDSKPKLNKLETAYQDYLNALYPSRSDDDQKVLAQAVRLELANGQWYKPDFWIPHILTFIEVKGPHAHRGGFENLKTAARVHRWASFELVWKVNGRWMSQKVLS